MNINLNYIQIKWNKKIKYIKILYKLNVLYKSKCIRCSLLIKYI
jgi:hypothetical protein